MYKANQHTVHPRFIEDENEELTLDCVDVQFEAEIVPTTPAGIERAAIVSGYETFYSVPVWTIDANNADIGPNKRPNP
jgi:hypothetical protein